jgi:putative intracellular protease/amidase
MKVLMVLTSHDQLGNTGRKTGFWLEELAAPYYVFKDAGAQITLASPKGGRPPLDPKSNEPNFQTDITRRFEKDADANAQLDRTARLDSVKQEDYDTVFYPGGHGPMWHLAEDKNSIKLLESFLAAGKTFAVVCHSTGALRHVKTPDGKPLVEGKAVTGFTNGEEDEVGLTKVVPFLVEDEVMRLGATFSKVKDWGVHTVADGQLITGQNPASSGPAARLLNRYAEQEGEIVRPTEPWRRRYARLPRLRFPAVRAAERSSRTRIGYRRRKAAVWSFDPPNQSSRWINYWNLPTPHTPSRIPRPRP